jgi:lipoprotein NlpI
MSSKIGDHYFEAGQYLDTIINYDKAIAVSPACADCFNYKGLALYYKGDTDAALASFDVACQHKKSRLVNAVKIVYQFAENLK